MSAAPPTAVVAAEPAWLDAVVFDAQGLVPVVVQDQQQHLLMLAWADRAALVETWRSGLATYYSRARAQRWRKGEVSGQTQWVRELRLDCDGDSVLYLVEAKGGVACHTGRRSCFYRRLEAGQWQIAEPVLIDPALLYRS